ncbi:hypothetical protein JRI60_43975 [Archangium violaceum]|uniref:hypothetical protein n=1 Tax=Archangium violaceum TaxID=83451 RepID=UPI001950858A|nr:hypothetical protein [Archangium violaceum]QRN95928.1 hypothetical protein JRI60_43975 [Archangium violaceum]
MPSASSLRCVVGALAALGLAGCGRTVAESVTLADLKDRTLRFTLTDVDSLERETSTVGAHRFTAIFSAGDICARLTGNVTATLNGQPMQLAPGGVPDTGVGGREVCEPPRVTFDFDPGQWNEEPTEDLRVILQDDTHSVVLVLENAKAKRHFLRSGGTAGTLRRGQTHTYVWLPETDTLAAPVQASLFPASGGAEAALEVQQDGNAARFLLRDTTVEGAYYLRLSGTANAQVLTCEGVAGCQGGLFHSEDFAVSVTP